MKTLSQLNLLYLALLAGQVFFAGVVYFFLSSSAAGDRPPGGSLFQTIVPLVVLGAAGMAYFLRRRRQAEASQLQGLQAKRDHYRASVITRSALLEGANLMTVVAALVEQNLSYLGYFAVGLLVFLYFRPSPGEFERDYGAEPGGEE